MFFDGVHFYIFCFLVILYMCNQFNRYLMPDSLHSYGRHELSGTIMSLCVDFLYIENCDPLSLQCIVRSKKLMDSCTSFSIVNFMDGCSLLNLLSVCYRTRVNSEQE
jgi:hypothetical protein